MTSTPCKWAILIGIDFYTDPNIRLQGAVNDVDDIEFWFSQNHTMTSITKLSAIDHNEETQIEPGGPESSWPTYDNILRELKRVTDAASPGDFVYLHYSGHGTLNPTTATEYQEDFGSDAALVLFDRENGVRYLCGIEIAALLDEMVQKDIKLTVVLDCCHSGGVSRDDKFAIRGIPWDNDIASIYPPVYRPCSSTSVEYGNRDASTNQHWLLKPQGYALMAACGPNEIASECVGSEGRIHGALTHFLFKALSVASKNGAEVTIGDIYGHICAELHVPLPQQHPMFLGNDKFIFLAPESRTKRSVIEGNVIDTFKGGRICLNIGYAQMVSLGDEYEIYAMTSIKGDITQKPIKYTITAVYALHSEAEQSHPTQNEVSVGKGWCAVLTKPLRAKAQVALSLGVNTTMEHMLNKSQWLELVDSIEIVSTLPSFQVSLTERKEYVILVGNAQEVQNLPIIVESDPDAARRVVYILEHLAKFASIEGLENERIGSSIQYESRLNTKSKDMLSQNSDLEFSILFKSKDDPDKALIGNIFHTFDGKRITVTFKNHTVQPLYLIVLDMTPLRKVSQLYPSSDRGYYKTISPKDENFRGEVSFTVEMSIPDCLKKANQTEVDDVLKFFITTRPTSTLFRALELPELSLVTCESERGQNYDQLLLRILENPFDLGESWGEFRIGNPGEKNRWTCRNFIIRTKGVSIHNTED
jgi:Caspase domain